MTRTNNTNAPAPRPEPSGGDIIDRLATALGQERGNLEKQLVEDRSALARSVLANQGARRVLSIQDGAGQASVERLLSALMPKESFLKKLVMLPIRGAKRAVKEVVFHPVRTAAIVIGGLIAWKFLRDSVYHRLMSEVHLFGSRAGWNNWRADVGNAADTLGGQHANVPIAPRVTSPPSRPPADPAYENFDPGPVTRPVRRPEGD